MGSVKFLAKTGWVGLRQVSEEEDMAQAHLETGKTRVGLER